MIQPHLLHRKRWAAESTKNGQFKHAARLENEIQTFNADFTTARAEGTNRNGTVGMYSGERDRWAGKWSGVEWKWYGKWRMDGWMGYSGQRVLDDARNAEREEGR